MDYATGLESAIRELVKRARLRPLPEISRKTRTLDQLANGERRQPHRLLLEIENRVFEAIKVECGDKWADWIRGHWDLVRVLETLGVTNFDCPSDQPPAAAAYHYLKLFIKHTFSDMKGPDHDTWLVNPFRAWVDYLSVEQHVEQQQIKKRICDALCNFDTGSDTSRTYRRWISGDNIGRLPSGHRNLAQAALGNPVDTTTIDHFTGWLLLSIGMQSMPREQRNILMQTRQQFPVVSRPPHPYKLASVDEKNQARCFVSEVTIPYQAGELNVGQLEGMLDNWKLRAENNPMIRVQYGRLRARIARARGDNAFDLYDDVVKLSAIAGWTDHEHHACLLEALGYQLQTGDKMAFRHFWDLARKSMVLREMAELPTSDQKAFLDSYGKVDPRRLRLAVIYDR